MVQRVAVSTSRLLESDRQGMLLVVKATVASAVAFELARNTVGSPVPALAAMAAIITVQVSASQTARRALEYSLGVAGGVIAALLLTRVLGVHWWSISLLTLMALVAGRLFRLGSQANQVAISALLVMSLGTSYGWARVVDTMIGATIGVVTSLAVPRPPWQRAVRGQIAAAASEVGLALRGMSVGVHQGWSAADARGWLSAARDVSRRLADIRVTVDRERDERGVPLAGRLMRGVSGLERCDAGVVALDHVTNEVRSIGRSLLAMATDETPVSEPNRAALGELLELEGAVIDAWARAGGAENPAPHLDRLRHAADRAATARRAIATEPRPASQNLQWSAILLETERIDGELDPSGVHGAAVRSSSDADSPGDPV